MRTHAVVVCLAIGSISLVGCRHADQPAAGDATKSAAGTPNAGNDKADVEAVARGFAKAIEDVDMKTAAGFVNGGKPDGDYAAFSSRIKPAMPKVGIDGSSIEVIRTLKSKAIRRP